MLEPSILSSTFPSKASTGLIDTCTERSQLSPRREAKGHLSRPMRYELRVQVHVTTALFLASRAIKATVENAIAGMSFRAILFTRASRYLRNISAFRFFRDKQRYHGIMYVTMCH